MYDNGRTGKVGNRDFISIRSQIGANLVNLSVTPRAGPVPETQLVMSGASIEMIRFGE